MYLFWGYRVNDSVKECIKGCSLSGFDIFILYEKKQKKFFLRKYDKIRIKETEEEM